MGREMRGTIPDDGVVTLLRSFEETRTSGLLVYRTPEGARGEVWLRLGQLDGGPASERDESVETFLALRGGTYELLDRLPPLEETEGSERIRVGSLGRYSIADLMNYAESAGLTGLVRVESGGRYAEIVYKNGGLDAIFVDGDESDADAIFAWSEGRFSVRIEGTPSLYPRSEGSGPRPEPRVIERPISQILDEAAQRRPRAVSIPPPRAPTPREGTVRIVLLGGQGEALVSLASAKAAVNGGLADTRAATPRATNRSNDRRAARPYARGHDAELEPLMPRGAVVVLALLLFTGLAAFVAVLMRMS